MGNTMGIDFGFVNVMTSYIKETKKSKMFDSDYMKYWFPEKEEHMNKVVDDLIQYALKESVGLIKLEGLKSIWMKNFYFCIKCGFKDYSKKDDNIIEYKCVVCGFSNKRSKDSIPYHRWSIGRLIFKIKKSATEHGIKIVLIDPYNTSKTCPKCRRINNVEGRIYLCNYCGFTADRDVTAAMNISRSVFTAPRQYKLCFGDVLINDSNHLLVSLAEKNQNGEQQILVVDSNGSTRYMWAKELMLSYDHLITKDENMVVYSNLAEKRKSISRKFSMFESLSNIEEFKDKIKLDLSNVLKDLIKYKKYTLFDELDNKSYPIGELRDLLKELKIRNHSELFKKVVWMHYNNYSIEEMVEETQCSLKKIEKMLKSIKKRDEIKIMTKIKYYVELKENPDYESRLEILMLKPDIVYPMGVGYAVFNSQETWAFEEDEHFKDTCETHKLDYEKESDRIDHLVNEYVSMMISSDAKYPYENEEIECPKCGGTEFYAHYEYENIDTESRSYSLVDDTPGSWICVICQKEVDEDLQEKLTELKGEIQ